jgi:hypothetical protein
VSEPASTWVHYWLFRLLHEQFNVGAKFVVALSSRVGGVVYLWAVARVSILLFPGFSPSARLAYRLLFFTAGATLLFYGYVENSPLALPSEQLWVLTSIVFLQTPSHSNLAKCAATLALATAFHGRVAFLAPALLFGCLIPAGSTAIRMKRAAFGGVVYFGLLASMVAYILLFERNSIAGGVYGNTLGGGNLRMFVPLDQILVTGHWYPIVAELFIAGGVLVPCGLLLAVAAPFKREPILTWALVYLLSDMAYLFLWEFDFGPIMDWDLISAGICPLLLLASIAVTRSRVPVAFLLPFLLSNVLVSMTFATIVNLGRPLALNVVAQAGPPVAETVCAHAGLRRTFFSDSELTNPIGPSETDLPNQQYTTGKPLGGVFQGYIRIPARGRYRFSILGVGNLRFSVANQVLFDHWTGFEWQIIPQREMKFPEAGWYPIRFEFFTTVGSFRTEVSFESAGQRMGSISVDDVCHD